MRVALGLGETDVVLGQHKVFLSQAAFHAMEDYLHATDVEEQKRNWMREAEVEAIGVDESIEYDEEYDEAKTVQSDRFNGRSRLTGDQDDSNSNYGTESYPPSNMFQHVDKEGLMAKDPLPGETMEGETTEIVKETSARRRWVLLYWMSTTCSARLSLPHILTRIIRTTSIHRFKEGSLT
ncbi:hypothetical protein PISMIDRAFT_18583 [Pisolithus microcarpus 441]|uniref:Uncharacterized protein n=1 Tax=Pisolithus microcarpus 441 TaxID=765257 RepID=A0A0C9Y6V4_9AGAM|nr:hypothetical protein PISMIDRAFT_18583 [Pisolithus microcarpus 441]